MKTKTDLAEKFAQLYYAEVDPEELAAREPRDLQGAAASHLAFGRELVTGKAKLRAYNPVREQHGWYSTHTVVEIVNDDMPFLVDSVTMEVNRQGLTLHLVIHPVLRIVPGSGLGILRERGETVSASFATLPPEARKRARVKELLVLTKANARSTVHRPGQLDYVGVKHFNAKGEVTGETRFLGLYTHTAYAESPMQVPLLRRKLADVIARAGLLPAGYSGKALAQILESYPRDELLQIGTDDLYRHAMAILQLGERQRLRLLVRQDAYSRFVACLIYVPRERYNTELRQRFQRVLTEAFNGASSEFDVDLSASALGRILMRIRTKPGEMAAQPDRKALEARLVQAMRRWEDDLYAALVERHGEERANQLWRAYEHAFPASYREEYTVR